MAGGGNAGTGIGVLVTFSGVWLLYAAIANLAPIKTVTAIIQNPSSAGEIVKGKEHKVSATPISEALGQRAASGVTTTAYGTGGSGGGQAIVAFARSQIGKPYATNPNPPQTWACAALCSAAVEYGTGIQPPLSWWVPTLQADTRGKWIARKEDLEPGDVVFPIAGSHAAIFSGRAADGTYMIVEAAKPGTLVRERNMWGFFGARRFTATGNPKAVNI
jgi:hypothetical protein